MSSFSSLATAAGVSSIVASTLPCHLRRMQGYFKGATADRWLQIHDAMALPANATVPLKSYLLPQTSPFSWEFDPGELNLSNGLVIAVSTTETTLTISTDKMDCFGEVEPHNFVPSDYSIAGDLSSTVDSLQVWAEAGGPKALYKLTVVNGGTEPHWFMLFATDNNNNGDAPLRSWKVVDGTSLVLDFGDSGLSPLNGSHQGCTIRSSTTAGTLTKLNDGSSVIQAFYK